MKQMIRAAFGIFLVFILGAALAPAVIASQGSDDSSDDLSTRTEEEVRGRDRSFDDDPSPGEDRIRTLSDDSSLDDSISTGTDDQSRTRTQTRTRGADDSDDFASSSDDTEDSSGDSDDDSDRGRGDDHRSEVARFVRVLLDAADRDGGLGEEVRIIAREQASSSEKVVNALEEVEDRGKIRVFFFGPDYKNLGAIRSEMVQTKNRIEQLGRKIEKASSTDATMIRAEILQMEQERAELEKYVTEREDRFSLFGWFAKMIE